MEHLKKILPFVILMLLVSACGGGNGDDGTTFRYTVGGSVTGLNGTLILQNNNGDSITISQNGPFVFSSGLTNRMPYNVTISMHPTGQTCWTDNGSGTISSTDATGILVECTDGVITMSGKVSVPAGVLTDSDVNDFNEKYAPNDTIASAQELPNPISVGGYVNRAFSGAAGRSFLSGDVNDYFKVQLKAGDTIALTTSASNTLRNDLDLYLYDDTATRIAFSEGTGIYEILNAPADGTYFVRVTAYSGASNYILTIGPDITITEIGVKAASEILSSQWETVPGQIVVRFKSPDQTDQTISSMQTMATMSAMATMGLSPVAGAPDREMLLTLDMPDTSFETSQAAGTTKKLYDGENSDGNDTTDMEKTLLHNTFETIKALRQRSDVASVAPNYILRNFDTNPDDTHYVQQWHYPMINLPQAWDHVTGDDNVIVAVLDTGVLMGHPDLSSRLTNTGYDFVSSISSSNDGDGIDPNPTDPGDGAYGSSSSFHGTHCAGTIAAATDNGIGVAGVTWNTKIMPIRVMGKGGTGTSYDVRQGIRYAAGLSNNSETTPAKPADIISMSFGGAGADPIDQELFAEVRARGIITIAAAGNDNTSIPYYPAAYDGVISVSAVDINGTKASYSNYGPSITLAAPGGNSGDLNGDGYQDGVLSTGGDDSSGSIIYRYVAMAGTSMAAPHVAGVVALMKAVYPALTPLELDDLIRSDSITTDIGTVGKDNYYGYGLINAFKAVAEAEALLTNDGKITGIDVTPRNVNFGFMNSSALVTVSPIGTGTINTVTIDIPTVDWLTVAPDNVDNKKFGTYKLEVDRSKLSQDGTYTTTVTFKTDTGKSTIIRVTIHVGSTDTAYDAGYHYVLLIRIDSNNTSRIVDECAVEASNGQYSYSFTHVAPGKYRIVAGSDRNNDNTLGDAGEALGAYPTLDRIMEIEVAGTLSDMDFPTDLPLSIEIATDRQTATSYEFSRMK